MPEHISARRLTALGATCLVVGGLAGTVALANPALAAGEPTIKTLSVTKGSTAGGTNVLITGTGFSSVDETSAASVTFGGTNATSFILLSDTQIAAKAPAGSGTNVQIAVTNSNGTSSDTTTDNFTYIAPITVTVPASTNLSAAGGTTFLGTITGAGVTSAADITAKKITATVNGATAKVAFSAADVLAITAPAGTPTGSGGKVTISVLSDGVTGVSDITNAKYVAVITKLSVASGPTAGTSGQSGKPAITITGVGFKNATAWSFGSGTSATCTNVTGKEDTSVTCQDIPTHASGPVTVSFTPDNSATFGTTAGATYTYTDLG